MKWANPNNEAWFKETRKAVQDYHQQIEDYLAGTLLINPTMSPDDFTLVNVQYNGELADHLKPKAIKEFKLLFKLMDGEEKILKRQWLFFKKDLE